MPPYLTHIGAWKAFWPLPLTVLLLSFLIYLIVRPKDDKKEIALILLAFSTLGISTGYITAFSREAAVGSVLPAVLSLFGGLSVFLIGKEKEHRTVISLTILSFSFSLLLGVSWGSVMRETAECHKNSKTYLLKQAGTNAIIKEFTLKNDALTEAVIKDFRFDLGLTEKPIEESEKPKVPDLLQSLER